MSIRAQFMSFILRRTLKAQIASMSDDIPAFRERMRGSSLLSPAIPAEVAFEDVDASGVSCHWVAYQGVSTHKVLLYLHGGGYTFGEFEGYKDLTWRLSKESGVRVLFVDYRLAPEDPFPAAVEDATAAYRWLLEQGYNADQIVIGGDSAGGGLAMALLVNLKNHGIELPCGAILLSPWVDLTASGESVVTNAKAEAMLSTQALEAMAGHYLGDLDRGAPLASPLFADLSGLPPVLVHVGSTEMLLSDAERLVARINESGGEAVLEVWPKMPHVFQILAARIPEGKLAIAKLGEFTKNRLVPA